MRRQGGAQAPEPHAGHTPGFMLSYTHDNHVTTVIYPAFPLSSLLPVQ